MKKRKELCKNSVKKNRPYLDIASCGPCIRIWLVRGYCIWRRYTRARARVCVCKIIDYCRAGLAQPSTWRPGLLI